MAHRYRNSWVLLVPCLSTEGGTPKAESVCFEENRQEAGTNVGAGFQQWRTKLLSVGGIKGDGAGVCEGEAVDSHQEGCWQAGAEGRWGLFGWVCHGVLLFHDLSWVTCQSEGY